MKKIIISISLIILILSAGIILAGINLVKTKFGAPRVFISTPATSTPVSNFSFTIGTSTPLTAYGTTTLAVYGSTTIQTWLNSLHAFEVFNAASSSIFRIDTVNGLLAMGGSGTSTFSNGISLSAGCFKVGGNCLTSGGGGSDFAWTPTADGNSTSTRLIFGNGFISQASSSVGNLSLINATTSSFSISSLLNIGGDYLNELCGTGLTCTSNTLALNATGDWTGTIDGNNFAGGAIGAGELIFASTAGALTGTTTANLKASLKLDLVENTALSTWAGTSNITTVGTLTALTVNAASITLSQDTNFVLSGGLNGASFDGTTLSIDATGDRVGVGTSTPGSILSVGGTSGINFKEATSTFSSSGGINLAAGCFAINGTCVGGGGGATDDWSLIVSTTTSVAMANPSISVATASSSEMILLINHPTWAAADAISIGINNDTGSNMVGRDSYNGAADISITARRRMEIQKNNTEVNAGYCIFDITNHYSSFKAFLWRCVRMLSDYTIPNRVEGMGNYLNSSSTISTFDFVGSSGQNVPKGTMFRVWGSSD